MIHKIMEREGKMLLLHLDTYGEYNGFLEEIDFNLIPKNVQKELEFTGGYGTRCANYFKSNTGDKSLGRYFIYVADRVKFQPKNHDLLLKLSDRPISFNKGCEIIKEALDLNILQFKFNTLWLIKDNMINCQFDFRIKNKEYFEHCLHPFENEKDFEIYKKFFIGRDVADIGFSFKVLKPNDITDDEFYKYLTEIEERINSNKYSLGELQKFIEQSTNQRWWYIISENKYFYGNEN